MNRPLQFVVGLACLGIALYQAGQSLEYARHGARVTGRVVENVHTIDSDGHSQRPVVEFVPIDATAPVRFRSSVSTGWLFRWLFGYRSGDSVPVVYLASDAAGSARIDGFASHWLLPMLLAVLGGFAVAGRLTSAKRDSRRGIQWTERE